MKVNVAVSALNARASRKLRFQVGRQDCACKLGVVFKLGHLVTELLLEGMKDMKVGGAWAAARRSSSLSSKASFGCKIVFATTHVLPTTMGLRRKLEKLPSTAFSAKNCPVDVCRPCN